MQPEQDPNCIFNKDYEGDSRSLCLEQYKLYVEMHDRISARRNQMNSFFISLLSGLLAVFSIVGNQGQIIKLPVIGLVVGFLGSLLCILWNFNICSYRRLVERKIKIILEMEAYLPFYCYTRENILWRADRSKTMNLRATGVEQLISLIFGFVYFVLMVYSLLNLK